MFLLEEPVYRFNYPGHSSSLSLISRIFTDSLWPQGPSLKSAEIIYVVVQTIEMLLLTCKVLLQFTNQAYIPGLKELQLTERASQSSPHQPGSLFSLQTRRAQSFWLLKNLRTTQPLSQKAKCPWEMGFFPKPSHMSKIKPEFCNLGGERIVSFVLFLAKCKSSHSFLSSLQPDTHWEPKWLTQAAFQGLYRVYATVFLSCQTSWLTYLRQHLVHNAI